VSDFIEEVEEQLRSDRYRALALRILPWFAAALVATIVGWLGVWGYDTWRDRNIANASIAYDKAITSLSQGDETGAYDAFAAIGKSGPAGYKTLSLILQGNIRLGAGKNVDAAGFYDLAAKAAPNPILGDLARLRAAQALMDTATFADLKTRLTALIGDKKPFDLDAREALALAKLQAGKTAEARGDFNALTITLGVSPGMRARAQGAIAMIDAGEVPAALAAVKAAAALPPQKPGSLGGSAPTAPQTDSSSGQGDPSQGQPQGDPGSAQ
jgi:hypothetical protein